MKKHYVSLETAKKLKEKGHRELVTHFYRDEKLTPCVSIHANESIDEINGIANLSRYDYSAPELHEVQQWLREQHKIEVIVGAVYDFTWKDDDSYLTGESYAKVMYYTYDICVCEKWLVDNVFESNSKDYVSYEQALEAGINEALELI